MVAAECGAGWIPHFLEHMDDHWWRNRVWSGSGLRMLPSEYFKRNWKATFIREPFAVQVRHHIGVDEPDVVERLSPSPARLALQPADRGGLDGRRAR